MSESLSQRRLREYIEAKQKEKQIAAQIAKPVELETRPPANANRSRKFKKCQKCKKPIDPDELGDEREAKGDNGRYYHQDCLELLEWSKQSEHAKAKRGGKVPYAVGRIIRSSRGMA